MRTRKDFSETDGLLSWGYDPENDINPSSNEINNSDSLKSPCQKCSALFSPMEMGVMGSTDGSCTVFREWIELCVPCMNKEIIRLMNVVGIPFEKQHDTKWIAENAMTFVKANCDENGVENIEKLLFLFQAKKSKK